MSTVFPGQLGAYQESGQVFLALKLNHSHYMTPNSIKPPSQSTAFRSLSGETTDWGEGIVHF